MFFRRHLLHHLRALCKKLAALFRRSHRDADLDEELSAHLEMLADENTARGMSPEEARRAARLALGGPDQIKEAVHEQRGLPFIESLLQDLHFAARMLRKNAGFTAAAVLTLALAIGANTAIFSVAYGVLLKPLPYLRPDRVVQVLADPRGQSLPGIYLSSGEYRAIKDGARSFADLGTYLENGCCTVAAETGVENIRGTRVSPEFFSVLGVRPIMGRLFFSTDVQPGNDRVVVISYRLWQQHFGGDPAIVGKTVSILRGAGKDAPTPAPHTILGVLPALFPFANFGDMLIPESPADPQGQDIAIARLADGISLTQANTELQSIAAQIGAENPQRDKKLQLSAISLRDQITRFYSTWLLLLLAAVGLVVLLACVNIGSLLIARCWSRHGEIAIRHTLGASRTRLARQLLTESILLALCGGACGLLLAFWLLDIVRAIVPAGTPRMDEVALSLPVFAYTGGVSFLAGIVFGLAPAWLVSRVGPAASLKDARPSAFGTFFSRRPRALRNVLVVAEIALAFLLVTGSTLAARSFANLVRVDLGFRPDRVLRMWVSLSRNVCANAESCRNAEDDALTRVTALPGIRSAAFASMSPLIGTVFMSEIQLHGSAENERAIIQRITPAYFETLGIPILKGRPFAPSDSASAPAVAIVNSAMAKRFFGGDPLGKSFVVPSNNPAKSVVVQIVGEARDTRDWTLSKGPQPEFYVPSSQSDQAPFSLLVRTADDDRSILGAIRDQVRIVDPAAPVTGAQTLHDIISDKVAEPRFQTSLLGAFGILSLLLAIVGIYGVVSYSLAQRTHELGVRLALGASPPTIIRLILKEELLVAFAGIALGAAASLALTRYLASLLFEIKPSDPITFVAVAAVLFASSLAAAYLPARRALRLDPITALRHE